MKLNFNTFLNVLFYLGIALTLYTVYTVYVSPVYLEGGCPIDQNKNLIYLSIGTLSLWFVLSFFKKKD
jgi:hypothetical protein